MTPPEDIERFREHGWELGAPAWAMTAKIYGKYSRRRMERASELGLRVAEVAQVTPEELQARAAEDEELLEAVVAVSERAAEVSDDDYREALARALAAAFRDDAKVDRVSYLCNEVIRLQPLHLRSLRAFLKYGGFVPVDLSIGDLPVVDRVTLRQIAQRVGVTQGMARSICSHLEAAGLIQSDGSASSGRDKARGPEQGWSLTRWGGEVLVAILQEA